MLKGDLFATVWICTWIVKCYQKISSQYEEQFSFQHPNCKMLPKISTQYEEQFSFQYLTQKWWFSPTNKTDQNFGLIGSHNISTHHMPECSNSSIHLPKCNGCIIESLGTPQISISHITFYHHGHAVRTARCGCRGWVTQFSFTKYNKAQ